MRKGAEVRYARKSTTLILIILLPFGIGYYISYLFRTVNAIISPQLVSDIGLSPSTLGLMTAAYFITFAAVQLPLGIVLDRFGPRKVQAGLLMVAALGAALFAFGEEAITLIIGRGLVHLLYINGMYHVVSTLTVFKRYFFQYSIRWVL